MPYGIAANFFIMCGWKGMEMNKVLTSEKVATPVELRRAWSRGGCSARRSGPRRPSFEGPRPRAPTDVCLTGPRPLNPDGFDVDSRCARGSSKGPPAAADLVRVIQDVSLRLRAQPHRNHHATLLLRLRLVVTAPLERPALAGRVLLEIHRIDARHTPQQLTPGEPGEFGIRPTLSGSLPRTCPAGSRYMLAWPTFFQCWSCSRRSPSHKTSSLHCGLQCRTPVDGRSRGRRCTSGGTGRLRTSKF